MRTLIQLLALSALAAAVASAEKPPPDLLKQVAAQGGRFEKERERYAYKQSFRFYELDRWGAPRGRYEEVREILFGPDGQRIERFLKGPYNDLKQMRLTEEDFRDVREMQPFVLTEDTLRLYKRYYEGEEVVLGRLCWVYRIRPKQVLHDQRLLDGRIWIEQKTRQAVQVAGQPRPQVLRTKNSNLFPRFTTVYEPIDGRFWFPVKTVAADTLPFSSGLQKVRYEIEFSDYKRFSAESTITFEPGGEKRGSQPAESRR